MPMRRGRSYLDLVQQTHPIVPTAHIAAWLDERLQVGRDIRARQFRRFGDIAEAIDDARKWLRTVRDILQQSFDSDHADRQFANFRFYPYDPTQGSEPMVSVFHDDLDTLLLRLENLRKSGQYMGDGPALPAPHPATLADRLPQRDVFIVYGHDRAARFEVAHFITDQLHLWAIMLDQIPETATMC